MSFYNTTTILTEYNSEVMMHTPDFLIFLKVIGSFILSTCLSIGLIEFYLYQTRDKTVKNSYPLLLDSENEEEEGEGEGEEGEGEGDEREDYCEKYYTEFSDLAERELTPADLVDWASKTVREMTPGGEVIMFYAPDSESFCYYTDQLKDISYGILDTVAQKFALEYNCKILCIDSRAEQKRVEDLHAKRLEDQKKAMERRIENPNAEVKSVFAKFKSYNKSSAKPDFNANVLVKERSNHFRFRGKIYEYEEAQQKKEKAKEVHVDYAAFKKMALSNGE